ncbi:MAG: transglutaminase family protein [Thermodesulfobacteriota bacterium]
MKAQLYLESSALIDWQTPTVSALAAELASSLSDPEEVARRCFEWVRDKIAHSGDIQADVMTRSASDVLREKTGWCFAKSHLLAALLRANGIPAGLCYQRLLRDDGKGLSLHGLNGVLLPGVGWYRVDARGNKPGVNAQFTPPREQLAWPIVEPGEADFPGVWHEPLPIIVSYLQRSNSLAEAIKNMPDIVTFR